MHNILIIRELYQPTLLLRIGSNFLEWAYIQYLKVSIKYECLCVSLLIPFFCLEATILIVIFHIAIYFTFIWKSNFLLFQGYKKSNQDRCTAFSYLEGDPDLAFFGVYDGHGGTGVANYLKDHLHEFILAQDEYRYGQYNFSIVICQSVLDRFGSSFLGNLRYTFIYAFNFRIRIHFVCLSCAQYVIV